MQYGQQRQYIDTNLYSSEQTRESIPIYMNKDQITIGVEKRQQRGSGIKKHVAFLVKGIDRKGEILVWRRFNQFHQLRQAMLRSWPGCMIPSLPSKNPVMKNQEEMVRKRERYLDDFLKKMAQRSHLYYSDEFQTFIRSQTVNLSETFQKWPQPQPQTIINRYKETFQELNGRQIASKTISDIFDFTRRLDENQDRLLAYRKFAKQLAFQKDRQNQFYKRWFRLINSYEQNIASEYTPADQLLYQNQQFQKLQEHASIIEDLTKRNPFWFIYDLIKNQQRDGRAFVQLLQSIQYYGDRAKSFQDKVQSNAKGIQEVSVGKPRIRTLMKKGTNQQIKYQLEVQAEGLRKQREVNQTLRDIVTAIVAFIQIEYYKSSKREFYLNTLRKLAILEFNFTQGKKALWSEVISGLQNIAQSYQ